MSALELKLPPLALTLALAALMWLIAQTSADPAPAAWRLVTSLALFATGATIGIAGVLAFRRARTTVNPLQPDRASTLVDSGVYRYTRNPMYLGLLLALFGWAAWLGNALSLLPALAFVPWMNRFQIAPEERALEKAFGQAFLAYSRRVRRWL